MLQKYQCCSWVIVGMQLGSFQDIQSQVSHRTIVRKANKSRVIGIVGWKWTAEILFFLHAFVSRARDEAVHVFEIFAPNVRRERE